MLRNLSIVNGRFPVGAGVLNQGTLTLDHVLLANNETTADGGGLGVAGAATQTTILNSTISGNVARRGGGIASQRTVIIRNSTIAENTAGDGGGLFIDRRRREPSQFDHRQQRRQRPNQCYHDQLREAIRMCRSFGD